MLAGEVDALVAEERYQPTVQGARVNVAKLLTQRQTSFTFVMPVLLVSLLDQLNLLLFMVFLQKQSLQQRLIVAVILDLEAVVLQHGEEGLLDHLGIRGVEAEIGEVVVGQRARVVSFSILLGERAQTLPKGVQVDVD